MDTGIRGTLSGAGEQTLKALKGSRASVRRGRGPLGLGRTSHLRQLFCLITSTSDACSGGCGFVLLIHFYN